MKLLPAIIAAAAAKVIKWFFNISFIWEGWKYNIIKIWMSHWIIRRYLDSTMSYHLNWKSRGDILHDEKQYGDFIWVSWLGSSKTIKIENHSTQVRNNFNLFSNHKNFTTPNIFFSLANIFFEPAEIFCLKSETILQLQGLTFALNFRQF